LMGGVCQRCGSNPGDVAMHFDHVDPSTKTNMISNMLMTKGSWDALLDEVKKCQLLCSNCHALKTFDPEAFALYLSR
jgi:5-methylcytosine-specific restriction endonuclease McrA